MVQFHFDDFPLANLLFLWTISFVAAGEMWAMGRDTRAGLLSLKEMCLVTLSPSFTLLLNILDMSTVLYS